MGQGIECSGGEHKEPSAQQGLKVFQRAAFGLELEGWRLAR